MTTWWRRIRSGCATVFWIVLWACTGIASAYAAPAAVSPRVEAPAILLKDVPARFRIAPVAQGTACRIEVRIETRVLYTARTRAGPSGACVFSEVIVPAFGLAIVIVQADARTIWTETLRVYPGWISLLPPFIAIVLSILLRQVVLAMIVGVWLGAWFVFDLHPITGFLRMLDRYIIGAYADENHVFIICFSLLLGGMVGIISRSGGTQGLVRVLERLARSSRSTQLATWLMGLAIFFDDYANTLFVGTSMRPLADRFRVSREKLSYLIDTTAAPVANIALISTWIGFEVSLIGDEFAKLQIARDPYLTFIESIPYRFYPIMALILPLWIILLRRDFGPMYRAELRARRTGLVLAENAVPITDFESSELMPKPGVRARWQLAVIPIVSAVLTILIGLIGSGYAAIPVAQRGALHGFTLIREVLAHADSYRSLLWGSAVGCLVAGVLALGWRILSLQETFAAWVNGMRSMFLAVIILGLAWSIGNVCADVQTAPYLIHFIGPWLSPYWIPALTTLVSALISFATGSSWATMSIVMPLVIPLIYHRTLAMASADQSFFLIATISSVLAGATFGDHCSPISDTTILSSIFSGADHIDHVRTQIPYALVAGTVAWVVGDIATAYGLPVWMSIPIGGGILGVAVRVFGRQVPEYAPAAEPLEPVSTVESMDISPLLDRASDS